MLKYKKKKKKKKFAKIKGKYKNEKLIIYIYSLNFTKRVVLVAHLFYTNNKRFGKVSSLPF